MTKPDGNLLPIPVIPGIREDVKQLAPVGSLAVAQNVRFSADSVYQRNGTSAVGATTAGSNHEIYGSGQALGFVSRVGTAAILGVDGQVFARDDVSDTFEFAGIYSTCKPLQQRTPFPAGPDRSFSGRSGTAVNSQGYVLSFATASSVVYWQLESAEGVRLYYGSETATKACVVAQGATFILIVQSVTTLTAIQVTISSGVVTSTSRTGVGTLTAANAYWDASGYSSGFWLLAYQSAAAVITLRNYNAVSLVNATTQACTGTVPLSIWGDSANGRAWLGWYNDPTVAGDVKYAGWTVSSGAWVVYVAATTIFSGANVYGPPLFGSGETGTGPLWIVQRSANGLSPYVRGVNWGWLDSGGSVEASFYSAYHVTPISKPDSRGRVWCVTGNESSNWRFQRVVLLKFRHKTSPGAVTPSPNQPTIELALDESVAPLATGNLPSRQYDFFHAVAEASTAFFFLAPKVLQQGPGNNELVAVDLIRYAPSTLQPHRGCDEYGLWTTIAGQPVQVFGFAAGLVAAGSPPAAVEHESLGAIEIGFAYRPAVLAATQQAGGNLTATGVYSWVFVYEWTDPLGQRHRSAPSVPYSLTLTPGNQQVQFSVASLDWHQKILRSGYFDPAIVAYRTVNGGATWLRETVASATSLSARGSSGVITYTSGASADQTDTLISASEILYTDGGVLPNALAPACQFTCRSEERMWSGGMLDPRMLQASKIIVPGEPVQFADSDTFRVLLPEPCTGIAYQDGTLFAFGTNAVYAITGDGPNDQGVGFFSPPRAIARDIGCIDYRSIVETSVGVFFLSGRGLHMIPRGGGVPQFIGQGIELSTAAYPYCLGAFAYSDTDVRTVRFLLSTSQYLGASGTQRVLVYDIELSAALGSPVWASDAYPVTLQCCGVWQTPVLGLGSVTAYVCAYEEMSGVTSDSVGAGPVAFNSTITTNVIRPWGMCGWGSIRDYITLLSRTSGFVSCTTQLYQDGAATDTKTWSPATSTEESYWLLSPQSGKCSSLRISHTIASPNGSDFATLHGWQLNADPLGERLTSSAERL